MGCIGQIMASQFKYAKKIMYIFLANAKYKDKNLKDSVTIARQAGRPLHVIGSKRYSLKYKAGKYQPYYYQGADLTFYGMLGGDKKK